MSGICARAYSCTAVHVAIQLFLQGRSWRGWPGEPSQFRDKRLAAHLFIYLRLHPLLHAAAASQDASRLILQLLLPSSFSGEQWHTWRRILPAEVDASLACGAPGALMGGLTETGLPRPKPVV